MNINWKASAIGGVAFWLLSWVFAYMGGLAGFGNVIAALVGGFVGAWQAKDKNAQKGGMTGAVAGVIGAVLAIIGTYGGLGYGTWMISLIGGFGDWIIWGLIFAAIGGAASSMMKRR